MGKLSKRRMAEQILDSGRGDGQPAHDDPPRPALSTGVDHTDRVNPRCPFCASPWEGDFADHWCNNRIEDHRQRTMQKVKEDQLAGADQEEQWQRQDDERIVVKLKRLHDTVQRCRDDLCNARQTVADLKGQLVRAQLQLDLALQGVPTQDTIFDAMPPSRQGLG